VLQNLDARVVTVGGNPSFLKKPRLDLNDLQLDKSYSGLKAAGYGMFARIYFAFELADRLKGTSVSFDFYYISLEHAFNVKYLYGQQVHDFNNGVLSFMAPNKLFVVEIKDIAAVPTGQMLLIHEDFF
jgi:hypothetical protein